MKLEETMYEAICEDPYQIGCKEEAAFVRIGEVRPKPDAPIYLCEDCYYQMLDDGHIKEDEWEALI